MEFLRASYTTNKAEWLIFKLQKATKSLQQINTREILEYVT